MIIDENDISERPSTHEPFQLCLLFIQILRLLRNGARLTLECIPRRPDKDDSSQPGKCSECILRLHGNFFDTMTPTRPAARAAKEGKAFFEILEAPSAARESLI